MASLNDGSKDFNQDVNKPNSDKPIVNKKVDFQVGGTNQDLLSALYANKIPEEAILRRIKEQLKNFDWDIYDMLIFLDNELWEEIIIKDKITTVSNQIMELKEVLEEKLRKRELRTQEIKEDFVEEMTRTLFNVAIKIKHKDYTTPLLKEEQGVEAADISSINSALESECKKIWYFLELLNLSNVFRQHNEIKSVEDLAKAYERYKDIEVVSLMTDEKALDDILDEEMRNEVIDYIGETEHWENWKNASKTRIRQIVNKLLVSYFINKEINYNIINHLSLDNKNRGYIIKILKDNLKQIN